MVDTANRLHYIYNQCGGGCTQAKGKAMKKAFLAVTIAATFGCASQPESIDAQYVSRVPYQGYNCDQLRAEADHINSKAQSLYNKLNAEADGDAAQMAVGLVLFWPALFFLEGGDGADAASYATMKGQMEAVQEVAHGKACGKMPPVLFGWINEGRRYG